MSSESGNLRTVSEAYKLPEDVEAKLMALPPEKQAMAKAMALRLCGWSIRRAASECGVAATTLFETLRRNEPERERVKVREIVEPLAISIAQESGSQTLEALHAGEIAVTQLPIVWGISIDKLHRLHQMDEKKPEQSPLSQLFELLHDGGRLSIEGPDGRRAEVETSRTTTTSASPSATEPPPSLDLPSDPED